MCDLTAKKNVVFSKSQLFLIHFFQVRHSSSEGSVKDDWCWDQNAMNIDIGINDVKDIVFVQKGYWIELVSTHDTEAYIQLPDSSKRDLSIKVLSHHDSGNLHYICIMEP